MKPDLVNDWLVELDAWLSANATNVLIKEWQYTRLWTIQNNWIYAKLVSKDINNNIIQQEGIIITAINNETLTITRAAYKTRRNWDSDILEQTSLEFKKWDFIEVVVNAEILKQIWVNQEYIDQIKWWIVKTNSWIDTVEVQKEDWTLWNIKAYEFIWDWSKLTWLTTWVSSASLNLMLWEDWTAWLAYSKVKYEQLTWTTANDLWTTSQPYLAQSFYWQTDISSISLMVATVSSPSDDILIEIQWDNAWVPDWTAIATSNSVNYSTLTSTLTETAFTFSTPVTVTEWTIYHIVVKRSWANDDVNYYSVWSAWADVQIWTMSTSDGSTWTNQTDDLYFKLAWYYLATKGWTNFIWILQVDKLTWEVWKFNTQYDNHQSWLTTWNYYWYNQTTWAIQWWMFFYAISDTELDLTPKYIQIKNTQNDFIAGEDISVWNALYIWTDWKVYLTDSADSTKINFIWFANNTALLWENISVNTTWIDWNQSWLTIWDDYFLDKAFTSISQSTYINKFTTTTQDWTPRSISINNDWTKIFMLGWDNTTVYEYILSTAYDITTATINNSFAIWWQDWTPTWIFFRNDWLKMFMSWSTNNSIYSYTLTTAWDISTASYDWISLSVSSETTWPYWIFFQKDWLQLFLAETVNDTILSYTLTTAFDISTATYSWVSFSVWTEATTPTDVYFLSGWMYMYVLDYDSDYIYEYILTTAWDISTASYSGNNLYLWGQDTTPYWMCFSQDYKYLFTSWLSDWIYWYTWVWWVAWWIINNINWLWNIVKVWNATSTTDIEIQNNNDLYLTWLTSTTATAWWITPPNIEWFITIKINWVDKKIAYYWI